MNNVDELLKKVIATADAGASVLLIDQGHRESPVTAEGTTEDGKVTIRVTVELVENE